MSFRSNLRVRHLDRYTIEIDSYIYTQRVCLNCLTVQAATDSLVENVDSKIYS